MKKSFKRVNYSILIFLTWMTFSIAILEGQESRIIKGVVLEEGSEHPVQFATVALYGSLGNNLLKGTLSNENGSFELKTDSTGKMTIRISFMGYKPWSMEIKPGSPSDMTLPPIYLKQESYELSEAIVVADRIKARKSFDKTTYYINKKIQEVSTNGYDLLKYIPGIQVDFLNNVKLEGSSDILILVDGKERDKGFLNQIDAREVDRVEIVNTPGARYDANVKGVVNVLMKKDKITGLSGNFLIDLPTCKNALYLFPSMNLNFGFKRINIYYSHYAEIRYFDLMESSDIKYYDNGSIARQFTDIQYLRQKNREQRINYGFDFFMNDKNIMNFYAFYDPYRNETDGTVFQYDSKLDKESWKAERNESDKNTPTYYSLYFKHLFNKEGSELSIDMNYYNYKRGNTVRYDIENPDSNLADVVINTMKPEQNTYGLKMDYSTPLDERFRIDAGVKLRLTSMNDQTSGFSDYYNNILSGYGIVTFLMSKLTINGGLRVEYSSTGLSGSFDKEDIVFLPNTVINFQPGKKQNLKLSYSRKVIQPYIYQLNPAVYYDDPNNLHSGNVNLRPELHENLSFDYSVSPGNQFISAQLFYSTGNNTIGSLVFTETPFLLESRINNMGRIDYFGVKLTNALKISKVISTNIYTKIYSLKTKPGKSASEKLIMPMKRVCLDMSLSSVFSFNHGFAASVSLQYSSPRYEIQNKTFNELLYFIQLEKTFRNNLKVGLSCAPLFAKEYTYRGLESEGSGFKLYSEGNVLLPGVPLGLRISYKFGSGKKIKKIERSNELIENKVRVGM
ncbi:MAG: TonB-dependent receptor [Bacteroidales bacterium]